MTPKEKADELYNKYNPHVLQRDFFGDDVEKIKTKQCTLIAVDEVIEVMMFNSWQNRNEIEFYEDVKKEIELL